MNEVSVGGRRVAFHRAGSGPALLLLHAFPFSGAMWQRLADALAHDHLVVVPDFPGFGGSEALPAEETTVARYAEAAEAAALAVDARASWRVVGLSMGGYVLFEMARRRALSMASIVLASTKAEADNDEQRAGRARMAETARDRGASAVAQALLPKMVTPACPAVLRVQAAGWMRSSPIDGLLGALHALATRPDSRPTLPTLSVPALLLSADDDPITPPADHARMLSSLPNARLVSIASASHLSCLEQHDAFLAAMQH